MMMVRSGKLRFIAFALTFALVFSIIPVKAQTVYADKKETSQYIELKNAVEKKYGIKIKLSSEITKNEKEAYYDLQIIKNALNIMPDELIKTVVKHFKAKGKSTTIAVYKKELTYGSTAGYYDEKENTITMYAQKAKVSLFGTGLNTYNILHEFGHMVQYALNDIYGYNKLKTEFTKLNGNKKYGSGWGDGYDLAFTWEYAVTGFSEDFAETFSASLCDGQRLQYIYEIDKNAPLIKKSEYIKNIIETQLKVKNLNHAWMIYPQTPSKKYAKVLNDSEYNNTGMYQYRIKKAIFYQYLCDLWIDLQLKKSDIDPYDWDRQSQLSDDAKQEFNDIFEINKSDWSGYIKRKDMALTLAKFMDEAKVDYETVTTFTCNDCDELSSKYKKGIKKVVNAGLMFPKSSQSFKPESYCTYEEAYYSLIKLEELMLN